MKLKKLTSPPIKLPRRASMALFLIGEELKSRKFFNTLHKVGFDYSYYQPHLDSLILRCVGLNEESDKVFDFYSQLMDKHGKRIREDGGSVMKQAFRVYARLVYEASRD